MKIHVKDKGSYLDTPITVQRGYWDNDNFEYEWCNHAGAYETESSSWYAKPYGDYEEVTEKFYACDKCDETWSMEEDDYELDEEDF